MNRNQSSADSRILGVFYNKASNVFSFQHIENNNTISVSLFFALTQGNHYFIYFSGDFSIKNGQTFGVVFEKETSYFQTTSSDALFIAGLSSSTELYVGGTQPGVYYNLCGKIENFEVSNQFSKLWSTSASQHTSKWQYILCDFLDFQLMNVFKMDQFQGNYVINDLDSLPKGLIMSSQNPTVLPVVTNILTSFTSLGL